MEGNGLNRQRGTIDVPTDVKPTYGAIEGMTSATAYMGTSPDNMQETDPHPVAPRAPQPR